MISRSRALARIDAERHADQFWNRARCSPGSRRIVQRGIMMETNMRLGLSRLSFGLALLAATLSTLAQSRITRIEVAKVEPAFGGERFGAVGSFERVTGRAHGEVDPNAPENSIIQDIALAPRNQRGMVEYTTDIDILLFNVINRGNKGALPPVQC